MDWAWDLFVVTAHVADLSGRLLKKMQVKGSGDVKKLKADTVVDAKTTLLLIQAENCILVYRLTSLKHVIVQDS